MDDYSAIASRTDHVRDIVKLVTFSPVYFCLQNQELTALSLSTAFDFVINITVREKSSRMCITRPLGRSRNAPDVPDFVRQFTNLRTVCQRWIASAARSAAAPTRAETVPGDRLETADPARSGGMHLAATR